MAAGDAQQAARGPECYKYWYNGNQLTGVVDDSFAWNGDDGTVEKVGRVDGKAALFRVVPGVEVTGSVTFKRRDWENQFPHLAFGISSVNQLAEAVFVYEVYDYVEGGAVGVGKARTLKSNPTASISLTSFVLYNHRYTANGAQVEVNWRGTISPV